MQKKPVGARPSPNGSHVRWQKASEEARLAVLLWLEASDRKAPIRC